MDKELNEAVLDNIVENTIKAMEDSKSQIFEIYENAKSEVANVQQDLVKLRQAAAEAVSHTEALELREKQSRNWLSMVSQDFNKYTEADIKKSYAQAQNIQVELAVSREKEISLLQQRNDLERRLRQMEKTVERAKVLVSKVGVMLGYLSAQMGQVAAKVEAMNQDKLSAPLIIQAQEDERLRVSREIHDGPAQVMANILYRSSACEMLIDRDTVRAQEELRTIRSQIRECLAETRQIIFDLRPMSLDDLGLIAALYHFIRKFEQRSEVVVEFNIIGEEIHLDKYHEIGIFRIIQEGLNNVAKHARVKSAKVVMEYQSDYVSIIIQDHGVGFDVEAEGKNQEKFGLTGMRERIKLLKGQLGIVSKPGNGVKLRVVIPLHPEQE